MAIPQGAEKAIGHPGLASGRAALAAVEALLRASRSSASEEPTG